MAYGLKYQGQFYNRFHKLVTVQIAKQDYVGSSTDIKIEDATIEFNYKDRNIPIAGTGARIVIRNLTGSFTAMDDLLTSLEKQFMCTIIYDGTTVYKGFSVCDLTEQEFLPKASVVLQFTDYLGRLDGHYLPSLDIAAQSNMFDLIAEAREEIGLHSDLYVNSTLFEENMGNSSVESFLEQTYVENNSFFENTIDYSNTYDLINSILTPPGAFFYSFGDKWVIERYEDLTRTGNWVRFTGTSHAGTSVTSLKQEYNKQDGDFKYTDTRQRISYDSGLKTLILNLKDDMMDTLMFNDYDEDKLVAIADETPDPGTLELRTWYYYNQLSGFKRGYNYRGMSSYLRYYCPTRELTGENYGIYGCFDMQFNKTVDEPIILNINFAMSAGFNLSDNDGVILRFSLRADGGYSSGSYIFETELSDKSIIPTLGSDQICFEQEFTFTSSSDNVWRLSKSINLTDQWLNHESDTVHSSIWEKLGSPAKQRFILMIWPPKFKEARKYGASTQYGISYINYLGDVSISVTQGDIPNKITYYINEDFIKTEEIDFRFYDLDNVNYANGLMYDASSSSEPDLQKTKLWTSENSPVPIPLTDIYAKARFRNAYRTMHGLNGKISFDGHLKPFSILTDDNLEVSPGVNRQFILLGYTWDLNNGMYEFKAEEYTDEEITLDDTQAISAELTAPTITDYSQVTPGDHMYIQWTAIEGASGYHLQRKPNWYTYDGVLGYWAQYWETIYMGTNIYFVDDIQETPGAEMPDEGLEVSYRVCAYSSLVNGPYSNEVMSTWYPA